MSFSLDNPAVQSYIVYSALLALKVLAMATLTSMTRMSTGAFANPEDAKTTPKGRVRTDESVERVRRAHQNDLENIPVFWVLGALYVSTGPAAAWATLLFRVFTAGRFIHSCVYAVWPLPQPARALAFGVPYLTMWYMGVQVLLYYLSAL